MTKKPPRYFVTGFYCSVCADWHYEHEAKFHECIDRYDSHWAFEMKKI